jgi:hypothetical protein
VGTVDQVLEAGVVPAGILAEAYIKLDDKKDDGSLVPTLVSHDYDYKVDKADAPDVESMLKHAATENNTDLETLLP